MTRKETAMSSIAPTPQQLRHAIFTGAVGGALEYYDFALYGLASALVFGQLFFPSLGPTGALLASFATYGAGFLARPFGGLFFGSLGDRKGRKLVLLLTVGLMGLATTAIGLLPTGPVGAVLLVLLRLLQGFGAGAEQSGATTLMAELAPARQRGLYAALPFFGIFAGLALATITFRLLQTYLSPQQILDWGWRLPFLASVVLIAMAIWIRLKLRESPVFENLAAHHEVVRTPMRAVLSEARRPLVATILMRLAEQGSSTLYATVSIAFLTGFVAPRTGASGLGGVGTNAVLWASLASVISTPLFGALSDRFGRLRVYRGGALFAALWAFPAWWMLSTGNELLAMVAIFGGFAIGANAMLGAQCAHFTELFGNRYRYSGVALSREVGALLSGGLAPLLGVYLLSRTGGGYWVMALYTLILALLTLAGTWLSVETRGREMTDLHDAIGRGADHSHRYNPLAKPTAP
ncbi:MHS family MFS transporter [Pseudomonas sp. CA3A]|uniref:MHS family MFS transporter n=2 Tax=Pseudomonas typographi TaxID=2715964 RepID=A0ABR7Z573_9PSED|nr:MHS family MFS transporter [Pseudomonas typographi]